MPAKIVFTGVNQFEAGLDRTVHQQNLASRAAVLDAGELVAELMRRNAPKKSGRLAESIIVTDPRPVGTSGWTVSVGPTVVYGRRMELGYHHRHEYAKPGFRQSEPALPPIFEGHWRAGIT